MVKKYALAAGLFLLMVVLIAPGLPTGDRIVAPQSEAPQASAAASSAPIEEDRVFGSGPVVAYEPPPSVAEPEPYTPPAQSYAEDSFEDSASDYYAPPPPRSGSRREPAREIAPPPLKAEDRIAE